jgi:Na+-transporting NADH:ubiquinone oxidoreductase subunit B
MRFLRNIVDKARGLYAEPGSKFHKFWPAFDSVETFLFTPNHTAPRHGPHVRDYMDLKRTMSMVIIAMIPCLLMSFYNTGYQHFAALAKMVGDGAANPYPAQLGWLQALVFGGEYAPNLAEVGFLDQAVFGLQKMIPILIVSYGVGLGIEVLFSIWRKEEVSEGYLVSGMLIALIVPASIPLWQLALACAFTVILAKEVFGGTGMNIFNPAMMARAFLFFAYAAQMSGDRVWVAGNGTRDLIDGYSGPTALSIAANAKLEGNHFVDEGMQLFASPVDALSQAGYSWWDLFVGLVPGSAGETSALGALIGALIMIWLGVASWRTMVSGVIGLVVMSLLMMATAGGMDGIGGLPPHYHLVAGGFAFGLVFMATDPVSSPETDLGKWIYGFLIGAVTILVRAVNPAYPEGMMLAVLLLNAFAPTIDHFVVQANMKRRKVRLG